MVRKLLMLTVLPAAGMGYAWQQGMLAKAGTDLTSIWGRAGEFEQLDLRAMVQRDQPPGGGHASATLEPELTGGPTQQLTDVLRFDVSPDWVMSRWSRVSAVRSEQHFKGLRVPLVTGTRLHDLAGSLTYYFDHQQRLRRVTFTGSTGDPQRLVQLAREQFGFRPVPDLGAGMFLVRWNGRPTSALRVSYAPVVRATDPLSQYTVDLEINRPEVGYQLSPRFEQIVAKDRAVGRW